METNNTPETTTDRSSLIKRAKKFAATRPYYEFRSNEAAIYVTDMRREKIVGFGGFRHAFYATSSGRRTKAEIAAGTPITWTVKVPENHED